MLGGYAVGAYGYPRATNDIDVFVSDDEANVNNLIRCLTQFGFAEPFLPEALSQPRSIIEMGVEPIKIQLMTLPTVSISRRRLLAEISWKSKILK